MDKCQCVKVNINEAIFEMYEQVADIDYCNLFSHLNTKWSNLW